MSRPHYDQGRDLYAEPYGQTSSSSVMGHSSHMFTLPPPRSLASDAPTGSGQQPDYHHPYYYPPPPAEPVGPYQESSSYTTMPRDRPADESPYYGHPYNSSRPNYQSSTDYPRPSSRSPPTAESRPPEARMGGPSDYYSASYHQRADQSAPRRPDSYRAAGPDQAMATAMVQRTSTFHASPPAITFGPVNPVPNKVAPVLNLIGPTKTPVVAGIRFQISVRQQPKAARACGSGERDRRNIDPPPVVQLHVDGPNINRDDVRKYLSWDGYVMNCWIYDESGENEASKMPAEYHYQRRLTGSQVAAPFFGRDERGVEGCFFTFSDLSVRTLGVYKLKFNMIMLDITQPGKSRHFPNLAEVVSDPFTVYTAKEFPGISESSRLVRALREQGCIISIKKGNEKRKKRVHDGDEDDDDESDD